MDEDDYADPLDDAPLATDDSGMPREPPPFGAERTAAHCEMLANRLRKNLRHVRKWAKRAQVTCYRVYDRDIPEVPLSVDWYDGRVCVAARLRPEERYAPDFEAWSEALRLTVAQTLEVAPSQVYARQRERQRGAAQYAPQAREAQRFEVVEGGRRLWVNLSDYLDTGLFLDHRPLRARVATEARGRRVLNLFCYTGAFTVHAVGGGATHTTSVDLSATYLQWARENLTLNGMGGPTHRLVREDVMRWLDDPAVLRERFDLVVADPPTFSNSKRMTDVFDVQRDHEALLWRLARVVPPGGVVYFSTNARRFRPGGPLAVSAPATHWTVTEISDATIPEDFRDRKIHRAWRLERRPGPSTPLG